MRGLCRSVGSQVARETYIRHMPSHNSAFKSCICLENRVDYLISISVVGLGPSRILPCSNETLRNSPESHYSSTACKMTTTSLSSYQDGVEGMCAKEVSKAS